MALPPTLLLLLPPPLEPAGGGGVALCCDGNGISEGGGGLWRCCLMSLDEPRGSEVMALRMIVGGACDSGWLSSGNAYGGVHTQARLFKCT